VKDLKKTWRSAATHQKYNTKESAWRKGFERQLIGQQVIE
jgi:hypothetical protein